MQLLIDFFVSRELHIAHTLSRHFSWSHNALFAEDLRHTPTTVVLSEADAIVPFAKTMRYLAGDAGRAAGIDVHSVPSEHGEMMLRTTQLRLVQDAIARRCSAYCQAGPRRRT